MGLCIARQLAEKGANIVVVARDQGKLEKSLLHIKVGKQCCRRL
jgi:short-subunit dehydrogenase